MNRADPEPLFARLFDDSHITALGSWNLEVCEVIVQQMLDCVYSDRNERNVRLTHHKFDDHEDPSEEAFVLNFVGAVCSQFAVAGIAPLFESLFTRASRRLREAYRGTVPNGQSRRCSLPADKFWDPKILYTNGETRPNLVEGFFQLLKAIGAGTTVDEPSQQLIRKLWAFRNKTLHDGLIWPLQERLKFIERLDSVTEAWFDTTGANKPGDGMITLTDAFVKKASATLVLVAEGLRELVRSIKDGSAS